LGIFKLPSNMDDYTTTSDDSFKRLSSDTLKLYNKEELADVLFVVGNRSKRLFAHRFILATRCPGLLALCVDSCKRERTGVYEVKISEKEDPFSRFLFYLYSGGCQFTQDSVVDVLSLAERYEQQCLKDLCCVYIQNRFLKDPVVEFESGVALFEVMHTYNVLDHFVHFVQMIEAEAERALETDAFLNLSEGALLWLVKRDCLNVSEEKLFTACLKWGWNYIDRRRTTTHDSVTITNKSLELKDVLANVLSELRYPVMSTEFLIEKVEPLHIVPSVLLMEAFKFHADPVRSAKAFIDSPKIIKRSRSKSHPASDASSVASENENL
jgi:hypothetical protein